GYGGAVCNLGALTATNCLFLGNIASGGNGGLGGTNGAGAFQGFAGGGGAGGQCAGGAIYSTNNASAMISACLFKGNTTLGGKSQTAGTVANNTAQGVNGAIGGSGQGGAVASLGTNIVVNSTFFANSATGGNGGNGGFGNA